MIDVTAENKAILTYKCLNNQLEGLDTNYLRHSEIHSCNAKFVLAEPGTEFMKRTFKYTSITLWNTLNTNTNYEYIKTIE